MEKIKLKYWSFPAKLSIFCYFTLLILAFANAAWKSYDKTQFNHEKTKVYYLGDESDESLQFPKEKSQLIAVSHVHQFSMAMVYFSFWLLMAFTEKGNKIQFFFLILSVLSILSYNLAPFLTRYHGPDFIPLFTIGGAGLFLSFFAYMSMILQETFKRP